jgi:hypothetical protein
LRSLRPPASPSLRPRRRLLSCHALQPLAALDHYLLRLDRTCRLLVAQRNTTPFEDTAQIRVCFSRIEALLADLPRSDFKLLVDVRTGPARNDPTFESVLRQERGKLLLGFARNAALAASAAGRLQIQRFAKQDGRIVFATDKPSEAFEYLELPPHDL